MPALIYAAAEKINCNSLYLWRRKTLKVTGENAVSRIQYGTWDDTTLVMDWLYFPGFLVPTPSSLTSPHSLPSCVCNSGGSHHASARTTSSSNPSQNRSESSYVSSRGRWAKEYWDSDWCQIPPRESRCLDLEKWIWDSAVAENLKPTGKTVAFQKEWMTRGLQFA